MSVAEQIRKQVRTEFPPAEVEQVLGLLNQYGTDQAHREPPRVHAAILQLSSGDLASVKDLVGAALQDYRDVLYWLELDQTGESPEVPERLPSDEMLTAEMFSDEMFSDEMFSDEMLDAEQDPLLGGPAAQGPSQIPEDMMVHDVVLTVIESPAFEPREVAVNPSREEIQRNVEQLSWRDITFVTARLSDEYWLEGSGSLNPEEGLSSVCCLGGTEFVTEHAPQSLDQIIALLNSFVQKDGKWRTMVQWC